jgi:hypothetical protein
MMESAGPSDFAQLDQHVLSSAHFSGQVNKHVLSLVHFLARATQRSPSSVHFLERARNAFALAKLLPL